MATLRKTSRGSLAILLSDDTERVCAVVCGCLRTTDGRPYGANMVRQSVANLTSVRIQGVDAFGVSEIDLKRVPNR